jgi:hypothetical protein
METLKDLGAGFADFVNWALPVIVLLVVIIVLVAVA